MADGGWGHTSRKQYLILSLMHEEEQAFGVNSLSSGKTQNTYSAYIIFMSVK